MVMVSPGQPQVLPADAETSSNLIIEIGRHLMDSYANTLKFRLARYSTVNVLLVAKRLMDGKTDNLTMSARICQSALWNEGTAGIGKSVRLSGPAKSNSTNHVLWEPAWNADFWLALLSSCGAQPLRKGDCIIELQFGVNLVDAVGKQIREWNGEACWLGWQLAASPAKVNYMTGYLEKMLGSCIFGILVFLAFLRSVHKLILYKAINAIKPAKPCKATSSSLNCCIPASISKQMPAHPINQRKKIEILKTFEDLWLVQNSPLTFLCFLLVDVD